MNQAAKALKAYNYAQDNDTDKQWDQYWDDENAIAHCTLPDGNDWLTIFADGSAIFFDGMFDNIICRTKLLHDLPNCILTYYKEFREADIDFTFWDLKGSPVEVYTQILGRLDKPVKPSKKALARIAAETAAIDAKADQRAVINDVEALTAVAKRLAATGTVDVQGLKNTLDAIEFSTVAKGRANA
jgi:hypothetical protein